MERRTALLAVGKPRGWALLVSALLALAVIPKPAFCLESLVLSSVRLRYDNSSKRDNGSLKVRALVDDNSTFGELADDLVAGTVTIEVSDADVFNVSLPVTGCVLKVSGRIKCRSADRQIRVVLLPTTQGPFIYNMRVAAHRLPDAVTGTMAPTGPVSVVLRQTSVDRADTISACVGRGRFKLVCLER